MDVAEEASKSAESRAFPQELLLSPLEKAVKSEKRPQQKVCCGAGQENWGLDLEEQREKGKDLQLAYLLVWP